MNSEPYRTKRRDFPAMNCTEPTPADYTTAISLPASLHSWRTLLPGFAAAPGLMIRCIHLSQAAAAGKPIKHTSSTGDSRGHFLLPRKSTNFQYIKEKMYE